MQNTQCEIIQVGGDNPSAGQSVPSSHSTLRPGYYMVMSRHRTHVNKRGGRVVRLFGPFPTRVAAHFLSTSAQSLGLVAAAAVPQPARPRAAAFPRALVVHRPVSIYQAAPGRTRPANVRPYHPDPGGPLAIVHAA